MRISDWSSDVCSSDLSRFLNSAVAALNSSSTSLMKGSIDPPTSRNSSSLTALWRSGRMWISSQPCRAVPSIVASRSSRSEEHTSELQSLMRISYAVFCLKKKTTKNRIHTQSNNYVTQDNKHA